MRKLFQGVGTALITPFGENGEVDYEALGFLVEKQVKSNVNFLVPCGSTGGSPTLTHQEHADVVRFVVERADGKVPVLAGTGSNNTAEAVALTQAAKAAGAAGALVAGGYYILPEEEGFRDFFEQVAAVGLPVVLYDIPSRTACGVPTGLILDLAREGVIAGVKWASGDYDQLADLIAETPEELCVLSGDDKSTLGAMVLGADGVISVASNISPVPVNALVQSCQTGNFVHARKVHYDLLPLFRALFMKRNPIPVKTAFHHLFGKSSETSFGQKPYFRSPLCEMDEESLQALKVVLNKYF